MLKDKALSFGNAVLCCLLDSNLCKIRAGEPITMIDPDMTRFMMTLDDAIDLVLYTFDKGQAGDIFVQKFSIAIVEVLAKVVRIIHSYTNYVNRVVWKKG